MPLLNETINTIDKARRHWSSMAVIALFSLLFIAPSHADDIEIYANPNTVGVVPNLVFVLDLSDSMNAKPDGTPAGPGESRFDALKNAFAAVLDDPDLPDVNVGLTYFQKNYASGIKFPATSLTSDANGVDSSIPLGITVKDVVKSVVNHASATGTTPTVDSLYEVAKYFRGEKPEYTDTQTFGTWDAGTGPNGAYTGGSGGQPDGWRAANPNTYTGSWVNVLLSDSGINKWCNDYSVRTPPQTNYCQSLETAGADLDCNTIPGQTCSSTTCDSGCGTYQSCPSGYNYTQPATGCLLDNTGSTWVTGYSNGQPSRCCGSSDAGGTECLSTIYYASSCSTSTVTTCATWNNREGYRQCRYRLQDQREYTSPITQQCQKNAVVLLTDGDPSINRTDRGYVDGSSNPTGDRKIRELIASADPTLSTADISCNDQTDEFGQSPANALPYANCGIELAEFMNTTDQSSTVPFSTVDTYTVAFGLSGPAATQTQAYLDRLATAGGGTAYTATNAASLAGKFKAIIDNITGGNQTFTSIATSFNGDTLQTADKTFITMFNPAQEQAWEGNLKGYYLRPGGLHDLNNQPATEVNADGLIQYKSSAQSFWSLLSDGNNVEAGGFRDSVYGPGRTIYTITDPSETTNITLGDGQHNFDEYNANITPSLLGMAPLATPTELAALINTAREARMGDPLHTKSKLLRYESAGDILYVMTNQGFLHAVNVDNPTSIGSSATANELFAFLPNELLGQTQQQETNLTGGDHIYGLDGPLTMMHTDTNHDGLVNGSEKAYLFFGMRRGGKTYYAMDVSTPTNPKLLWQIDAGDAGFEKLGQTWSSMTMATVNDDGTTRDVLIFAGGYDVNQDVMSTVRSSAGDAEGLGIYIVDPLTGVLLNSAGPDSSIFNVSSGLINMKYAIPADIRTTDSNGNGIHDRIYLGDLGGQIWRFDIVEGAQIDDSSALQGYRLADLGLDAGVATTASNRRFYYAPSIARVVRGGYLKYAISIGSGYRAHPLDIDVQDQMFAIFDDDIATGPPPASPTPGELTHSQLYDASSNILQTGTIAQQAAAHSQLDSKQGWYLNLRAKEKVLSRVRIFRNKVFATSFTPESTSFCNLTDTTSRLYGVNLLDATGAVPVYNSGVISDYERDRAVIDQAMIPDEPVIVSYYDNGLDPSDPTNPPRPPTNCTGIFSGTQNMLNLCNSPVKVNWQKLQ